MNEALAEQRYVRAPKLLRADLAQIAFRALRLRVLRGDYSRDDQAPGAFSFYGDSLCDSLLLELQPSMEHLAGEPLIPTYSYGRVYTTGNVLAKHKDRDSCEVSASIQLGSEGAPSALWLEPDVQVVMEPGDGVVYLGREIAHWREPFAGSQLAQVFLHYVRLHGPFSALAYDQRPERFFGI